MSSHNQVAANVRKSKEKHPDRYCAADHCLWRTDELTCPRHKPESIRTATVYRMRKEGRGNYVGD